MWQSSWGWPEACDPPASALNAGIIDMKQQARPRFIFNNNEEEIIGKSIVLIYVYKLLFLPAQPNFVDITHIAF